MATSRHLMIGTVLLALALLPTSPAELVPPAGGESQPVPTGLGKQDEQTNEHPNGGSFGSVVEKISEKTQSTTQLSSRQDSKSTIKRICRNKPVPIQSISEMLYLIKEIDRDESRCHDNYMAAIYELEPLLLLPKERFCETIGWALIERYHFRFIQPYRRANRKPSQFEPAPKEVVKEQLHPEPRKYTVEFDEHDKVLLAPLSIRHFFLKFALQVSHQCKMDLIRNLARDQQRILLPGDLDMMAPFSDRLFGVGAKKPHDQNPVDKQALRSQSIEEAKALALDFDTVLHMPELDGRIRRENGELLEPTSGEEHKHLHTNARADSLLYRMIIACKSRFRPLYEKLILPIVRLSKLGYDYQGPMGWSEEERSFLEGQLVREWLVAVHVCESFKNTHLVKMDELLGDGGDGSNKSKGAGKDNKLRDALDVIEDEPDELAGGGAGSDAEQREGKLEPISEGEAEEFANKGKSLDELLKAIEYTPSERFLMPNELMIVGLRDLDLELSRKSGHTNPFGFFGWLRRLAGFMKGALAKLDPERFAHYRQNSLWYAGVLNFFSSVSNVASITITVYSIVQTFGG